MNKIKWNVVKVLGMMPNKAYIINKLLFLLL